MRLKFNYLKLFRNIIIFLFFIFPSISMAEGMTISITPPLIKNNINPGTVWKSAVKVVNNNPEEIKVYMQVSDFESGGGEGTVKFLPENNDPEAEKYLLSKWINIESGPITIGGFKSEEIPFIIDVPDDAAPGGYYAAIMVGTKPEERMVEGSSISVGTMLASLILLNINGDVIEKGRIREFSTDKSFYSIPDVNFKVVFENMGNVHVQPQGEVRIFNLLNKDVGSISINHNTEFGNVLPGGTREWSYNWKGEESFLNMGRYKAELILGYGQEARQTENIYLYFWVLDFKMIAIIVVPFILFFAIVIIFVKISIRRAIKNSGLPVNYTKRKKTEAIKVKGAHIVNLKDE